MRSESASKRFNSKAQITDQATTLVNETIYS